MHVFSILRDAWYFYSRHLGAIARLCLPLLLLESTARLVLEQAGSATDAPLRDLLVGLLFYPLYNGALILFIDSRNRGLAPGTGALLRRSLPYWLPLATVSGLSTLLVMFGTSLFILPGLWLMAKLALSEYLLVLRGQSPLSALRDSFRLTRGHLATLLGCVVCVIVPLWILDAWLLDALPETAAAPVRIMAESALGLAHLFASVAFFRCYMLIAPEQPA